MENIKLFAVLANQDQTEGRGPMYEVFYASSKELALKIVNHPSFYGKYGVMGNRPHEGGKYDIKEKELICFDTMAEYFKHIKDERVLTALSKLTDEEKKLLNLI